MRLRRERKGRANTRAALASVSVRHEAATSSTSTAVAGPRVRITTPGSRR